MSNIINTLINGNLASNGKTTSKLSTDAALASNNVGTLAKLASEMQLIEGLQPIRITGSRNVFLQQTPVQLIEASTTKNTNFTLLNSGTPIDILQNKNAELELNTKQQITNLVLNSDNNAKLIAALSNTQTNNQISNQTANSSANLPNNVNNPNVSQKAGTSSPTPYANSVINAATTSQNDSKNLTQITTHPDSQKRVIQQAVVIASDVKTLKVVGHGLQPPLQTPTTEKNTEFSNNTTRLPSNSPDISTTNQTLLGNKKNNSLANIYAQNAAGIIKSEAPETVKNKTQNTITSTPTLAKADVNITHTQNTNNIANVSPIPTGEATSNTKNPLQSPITSPTTTPSQSAIPSQTSTPTAQNFTVTDGNVNFEIQSNKNLPIGSQLQVFVDQKGQLQMIPQGETKQPSIVNNALSQSLPQQFNEQELVKAIHSLNTTLQNKDTPPTIQKAISELLQSFPNYNDLKTADALKQSLQSSGAFLENTLLTAPSDSSKDVKLQWLKLHSAAQVSTQQMPDINTNITEQLKNSHHALERITTNQLKNLVEQSKSDFQNTPIFIELPIRDKETTSLVQFQIERDASQTNDIQKEKRRWLAKLRFDFPETGKFEARVRVKENQAGIIFVAEEKDTERVIRQNFSTLKTDLEKKEIELEQLDCFCRSLTEEKTATPSDRLIDVRT